MVVEFGTMFSHDEQRIEAAVTIQRPVADVFRFYRDFTNLPRFLGDVMSVDPVDSVTYRWTIAGPVGTRAHWIVRITAERPNEMLTYATVTSPGWQTHWQVHFTPGSKSGETNVRETMSIPSGRLGRVALAMIGKFPAGEMRSNLNRLKQVMEKGGVTDESYAVACKFPHRIAR